MKISPNPTSHTMSMLTCLCEMEKTMAKCAKHGAAAQMLTAYNTIPFDLDDLFRTVETCYNDSTCQLVEKVEKLRDSTDKEVISDLVANWDFTQFENK